MTVIDSKTISDDHNLQNRQPSFTDHRHPEGTLNAEHRHSSLRNCRRRK